MATCLGRGVYASPVSVAHGPPLLILPIPLVHRSDAAHSWLLELLLKILELTGKRLDTDVARATVDGYFVRLDTISKTHPDTRLRHLTFNVLELRKADWKTRREVKNSDEGRSSTQRRAAEWALAQADFQRKESGRAKKAPPKGRPAEGAAKPPPKKDAEPPAPRETAAARPQSVPSAGEPELSEAQLEVIVVQARSTLTEFAGPSHALRPRRYGSDAERGMQQAGAPPLHGAHSTAQHRLAHGPMVMGWRGRAGRPATGPGLLRQDMTKMVKIAYCLPDLQPKKSYAFFRTSFSLTSNKKSARDLQQQQKVH